MRAEEIVTEYGRRGHPGYGRSIFSRMHYVFIVNGLSSVTDAHIKEYLVDWFASIFKSDNPNFSASKWASAVEQGSARSRSVAKFEQRHFYYLAEEICKIQDDHAREFVAEFVGDLVASTNPAFKKDRWFKVCNVGQED